MIESAEIDKLIIILNDERIRIIKHYNKNVNNHTSLLIHIQRKIFYKRLNLKLNLLLEIIEMLKEYKNI